MTYAVDGIHHVTAGASAAQEDIDFFTQAVGQRMIKQTVLFDGTKPIYHLYYANKNAEIGSVMTTFPFKQAGLTGKKGSGQVKRICFSVPPGSLKFWRDHSNIATSSMARSASVSAPRRCIFRIPPVSNSN